jgi:hypothetical protein
VDIDDVSEGPTPIWSQPYPPPPDDPIKEPVPTLPIPEDPDEV